MTNPVPSITPRAVALFQAMLPLESRCACIDGFAPCVACTEWGQLHQMLHSELGLEDWQWPAVISPDVPCDLHRDGSPEAEWHQSAQRNWQELEREAER